MKYRK